MGLKVKISSKKVNFEFELTSKVTIIRGNSGRGKSVLTKAFSDGSGAYKVSLSDPSFIKTVLHGESWYSTISNAIEVGKSRHIFIIDDEDWFNTHEFGGLLSRDTLSLYVIINRFDTINLSKVSSIDFSIYDMYDLKTNGKNHWLEPICVLKDDGDDFSYDYVITEDSASGYNFLQYYNKNVLSSEGKSKIAGILAKNIDNLKNYKILLFVDLASFGSCLFDILTGTQLGAIKGNISLVNDYQCFEYLLYRSNLLRQPEILDLYEILKYKSKESMYEEKLAEVTKGKPYHQKHGKGSELNDCFVKDCTFCEKKGKIENKKKVLCTKGLSGNKLQALFKGTKWESTFKFLFSATLKDDLVNPFK